MTYIDSFPLRVIKQLIKAEFYDIHHDYDIELGALNLDDDELCPQEDEVGDLIQWVKVMVHVNSPKEDDPAQCWHPWTLIWNCNNSEFGTIMRDDQTQHIDIDVLADDVDEIATNEDFQRTIDFAPIKTINMGQLVQQPKQLKYEYEDKKKRTIDNVLGHISETLAQTPDSDLIDHFRDHSIIISRLHVHDNGECYVTFERVEYDEEQDA